MDLRIEKLSLEKLQEASRNPKLHSAQIETSIGRFGFVEPIVLDERTSRIVAGHGRRVALLKLKAAGAKPPNGVSVDDAGGWLVPVVRGWASKDDHDAEAYLIASNKLVEAGGWDELELSQMLSGLSSSEVQLSGLGFDGNDLNRLIEASSFSLDDHLYIGSFSREIEATSDFVSMTLLFNKSDGKTVSAFLKKHGRDKTAEVIVEALKGFSA